VANDISGAVDFSKCPDLGWLSNSTEHLGAQSANLRSVLCVSCLGRRAPELRFPHLTIASDVRLHNRAGLLVSLGFAESLGELSDDDLVLAAYDKWGAQCGHFLLGEFSFAIWDERSQSLFCCRDHMGFRPILYWNSGLRFVFASDPRQILSFPGVPRLLNRRLFARLAMAGAYESEDDDTFHAGICSLPAGSALTFTSAGLHVHRYWQPEIRSDLVPRDPEEVFESLRTLLIDAVECRLSDDSPSAVELSGGLDSSGVAAVAARCLERQGKSLLALAAVVPEEHLADYPDERSFIQEFSSWPNILIQFVSGQGRGPFDIIGEPGRLEVSPLRASTTYLNESLRDAASANGAQSLLTGTLGELGPTCYADTYFVELAVKLRWPTLWKELSELRKAEGVRPVRHLAGRFRDLVRPNGGFRKNGALLLNPKLRAQIRSPDVPIYAWPDQRRQQLADVRRFLAAHATWQGHTRDGGIRRSHPWLDKRVIEFCLAVPPELKIQYGYRRYLIRRALDGILPKQIQWRTTKTAFSPDYYTRYNRQLGMARDYVSAIRPQDPVREILDIDRLSGLLVPVDPGGSDSISLHVVPANIYAICFLRQFDEFRL